MRWRCTWRILHLPLRVMKRHSESGERRRKGLHSGTAMTQREVAYFCKVSCCECKPLEIGEQRLRFSPVVEGIEVQPQPKARKSQQYQQENTRSRAKSMRDVRRLRHRTHCIRNSAQAPSAYPCLTWRIQAFHSRPLTALRDARAPRTTRPCLGKMR